MKKPKFKIETLAFSLAMAVNLLMPSSMIAQGGGVDGFFKGVYDVYENRDGDDPVISGNITNNSFEAPTGGGLLIMFAAGAIYAVGNRFKIKDNR